MKENSTFLPKDFKIEGVYEEKTREADIITQSISMLLQVTEKPIYLIDLMKDKIVFASEGLKLICGIKPNEMVAMGHSFFTKYVPMHEHEQIDRFMKDAYMYLLDRKMKTKKFDKHEAGIKYLISLF